MINKDNQELKDYFISKGITNVFSYSNKYCDVFITDKNKKGILETGTLKAIGEENIEIEAPLRGKPEKKQFTKYIKTKKGIIDFDEFHSEEFLKSLDLNGKTGFCCGVDIETGNKPIEYFKDYTNIHIAGSQGSGKSITLFTLFYQLYHKEHIEFIIFDKGDLQFLNELPKVVAGANVLTDYTENLFQLYNYLFLQARRRKKLFAKAGVPKYYDYMEKYYDPNCKEVTEPLNHIFVIMDEYNTWRSVVDQDLGNGAFDSKIADIINVLRFAGVSLIPATQTLYASDIGVLSRGGTGNQYAGKVTKADMIKDQNMINNLNTYITTTFLFYGIGTNTFHKSPYIQEVEDIKTKLEKLPLAEKYSNLKTDTLSNLVNRYLISIKNDSEIMGNYEENFKFFGLTTNQIKELEKDFLFPPFCVLIYKIKNMYNKGVLDQSYDLKQTLKFANKNGQESVDNIIQKNLEVLLSKNEKKFIKEIENSFEIAETDPDEFINTFGEILRTNLIRRGIINNDSSTDSEIEPKKITKKEEIKNTEFNSRDELLTQVLEENDDEDDFTLMSEDDDDNYNSYDEENDNNTEHKGMQDIADLLRNS